MLTINRSTFEDFLAANPNCSGYRGDSGAQRVFELLSEDASLIAMAASADMGKPALLGCVGVIEQAFDAGAFPSFDLSNDFVRTAVGRMAKIAIAPLGYEVTQQTDFPKGSAKYFKSASCYAKTGPATLKIVKTIVPV